MSDEIIIHTDGGSRGNPGPASCAFVVERGSTVIYKGNKFLGKSTNNYAEYSGVLLAIDWLRDRKDLVGGREILFYSDSELMVRQLSGLYKVKDTNLKKLYSEIKEKIGKIGAIVRFKNIPREQNKIADLLVNDSLDMNS